MIESDYNLMPAMTLYLHRLSIVLFSFLNISRLEWSIIILFVLVVIYTFVYIRCIYSSRHRLLPSGLLHVNTTQSDRWIR